MMIQTYKLENKFKWLDLTTEEAVWFGDPCYVVPGWEDDVDLWDELCNKMFKPVTRQHPDTGEVYTSREPDFDEKNNVRVVEMLRKMCAPAEKFYMWSTAYGDGSYPLCKDGKKIASLGVDAGCLSLVPMSVIKAWGKETDAKNLGHIVSGKDNRLAGTIEIAEGDMFWGDFSLHTNSESQEDVDDEEWEEHWAEQDEEMYG